MDHTVVDCVRLASIIVVVAEAAAGFTLGGFARESFALHELFDAPLEMEAQLGVEVGVDAFARVRESEDAFHAPPPPLAFTMSPTTVV